jgi:hypothetical protein
MVEQGFATTRTCRGLAQFLILTLLTLFVAFDATADSWPAAQTREVFSASREYFVRVVPGESVGDTVGFFGGGKGKFATAEFYRRARDRSYQVIAQTGLPHPIAPVEFFVADIGRLATVDNWHNMGYGKIVSIYDSRGELVRFFELRDLFSVDEIKSFPHSVSSIQWRKGPLYIREDQKTLLITVKSGAEFLFGLESGQYQYCEQYEKSYRCRNSNEPREWTARNKAPLTR